jgi:hypothetical protein
MNNKIKILLKNFIGDIGMKSEYNRVQGLKQTLPKVPKGSHILDVGAGPHVGLGTSRWLRAMQRAWD